MRKLPSWIDGFLEYTAGIKSPKLFRTWGAISAIAGALGRKVEVRIEGQIQYANMYILLVSPAGIGKSNALKIARGLMREVTPIRLTPTKLTERALYDALESSIDSVIDVKNNTAYIHCSLSGMIDELGLFLPRGDMGFMETLAEIYDNPEVFEYKTYHSGENTAQNVCFNMSGGITPKNLRERFTPEALDQGFPSRCLLIYTTEKIKVPLFSGLNAHEAIEARGSLRKHLIHDLECIHMLRGRFQWKKDAAQYLSDWVEADMPPAPQDARLEYYGTRRLAHVTKLAMIHACAEKEELVITKGNVEWAKQLLLEAEVAMIHAIDALAGNPYYDQSKQVKRYVETRYLHTKRPVPEREVRRMLLREVPPQIVGPMLENIIDGGMIDVHSGEKPRRLFQPERNLKTVPPEVQVETEEG